MCTVVGMFCGFFAALVNISIFLDIFSIHISLADFVFSSKVCVLLYSFILSVVSSICLISLSLFDCLSVIYLYSHLSFHRRLAKQLLSLFLGQVAEAQNKQKLMDIQRFLDTSGELVFSLDF
jgi:hypothetical protein